MKIKKSDILKLIEKVKLKEERKEFAVGFPKIELAKRVAERLRMQIDFGVHLREIFKIILTDEQYRAFEILFPSISTFFFISENRYVVEWLMEKLKENKTLDLLDRYLSEQEDDYDIG